MSDEWVELEEAFEIIDETSFTTYKSGGSNEISDAAWVDYVPPDPYSKNSTRNLQFNEHIFRRSPSADPDSEGDDRIVYVATSDGYTWGELSLVPEIALFKGDTQVPDAAVNLLTPPAGTVKVFSNLKCQDMKFWAAEADATPILRYFVTDEWGNRYIMHASGGTDDEVEALFDAAVLPTGWTRSKGYLDADLVLEPATSGDICNYTVFRDSADNTYHQIGFAGTKQIGAELDGFTIWGGTAADALEGRVGSDTIRAAEGADTVEARAGLDTVYGDDGEDAVSGGAGADRLYGNAADDTLSGGDGIDVLFGGQEADLLFGNPGADAVYGNLGADTLYGGQDGDVLYGNEDGDTLDGNLGADMLCGGQGDDAVSGGAGDDTLQGNLGDDRLFGGAGADVFEFEADGGDDTIAGFAAGADVVAVAADVNGSGIADAADLLARTTDGAAGALIDLGDGNAVTLSGVASSALDTGSFLVV